MQHDVVARTEELEMQMEHLISIPDEKSGTGGSRSANFTTSSEKSRTYFLMKGRWILYTLREIAHVIIRPFNSDGYAKTDTSRSLMAKLFGFTTSRGDNLGDTSWLDGLRGVAAFLVMVYHYHLDCFGFTTEAPYGAPGTQSWELWRLPYLRLIWCSGHTQVGIFFVLSGFVLSWSSLSSIRSGQHEKFVLALGSTAFRRWVRLFVPCFGIGLLSLILFYTGLMDLPFEREASFLQQMVDYFWACERFANPFHLERNQWEVLHKYNHTMWTMPVC